MTHARLFAPALLAAVLLVGCKKDTDPDTTDPQVADHAPKTKAANNLKQIGLALHNHEASYMFLPAGIVGPKGELGLSWRVQILPFIEEEKLYKEFRLNEPWDSEHNKKLLPRMPKLYESPGKAAPEGKTYLRSFSGETAFLQVPNRGFAPPAPKGKNPPMFPNLEAGRFAPGHRLTSISDGTSNTLAVAEAQEPVEWTRPDDLPFYGFAFGPNPPAVPKLGGVFAGGFHGLMCDGAVRFFPDTLSEKTLRAMITANGGEVLDSEVAQILFPDVQRSRRGGGAAAADPPETNAKPK